MTRPVVAFLVALVTSMGLAGCSSSKAVPYHDAAVTGALALCDRNGHEITHGTTTVAPFVWRAVSAVAAKPPYDKAGRTATLYAFQPRQGTDPRYWSGALLTTSSQYTNAAHPMSQLTAGDLPLSNFLSTFPPHWDGLIQLRLYLGAPGVPPYSASYAAADVRVTGTTWQVVKPATLDCNSGTATSLETQLLPSTGS